MKEIDPPIAIEIRADQQQKQKIHLKDRHLKRPGLTVWEYCMASGEVVPAHFELVDVSILATPVHQAVMPVIVPENHRAKEGMKLVMREGYRYVQALNKKNALRHFKKHIKHVDITILKTLSIGDSGYPFDVAIEVEYTETEDEIIVSHCLEDKSPWDNPPELWYRMIEEAVADYLYERSPDKKISFKL